MRPCGHAAMRLCGGVRIDNFGDRPANGPIGNRSVQLAFDPNDADSGQLLSASFMDYCLPRADDLPRFDTATLVTPCTTNPLGVKGCGEAGAVAGFPAIGNAIADALAAHGIGEVDEPVSAQRIWRAIQLQPASP